MGYHILYPMFGRGKLVIQIALFLELSVRLNNSRSARIITDELVSSTSTSLTAYDHSNIDRDLRDLCELFDLVATNFSPFRKKKFLLVVLHTKQIIC